MEDESWTSNHVGGGIMEEESCRRNHEEESGRKESSRRNHGGIREKESCRSYLGGFWEASGEHLGGIHLRFPPLA